MIQKSEKKHTGKLKTVAIVVAHPDDETLWTGGTILDNPNWQCFIVCLCRKSDTDRAPKYYKVLEFLNAQGVMADLDDGPDQNPLDEKELEHTIIDLLPKKHFDLIITHNPAGEYTRHRRHEETGKAMINLWFKGKISTDEFWTFAYEDGDKKYLPRPVNNATLHFELKENSWLSKYKIITEIYGFDKNSWEAKVTPEAEAFWKFKDSKKAKNWLDKEGGML